MNKFLDILNEEQKKGNINEELIKSYEQFLDIYEKYKVDFKETLVHQLAYIDSAIGEYLQNKTDEKMNIEELIRAKNKQLQARNAILVAKDPEINKNPFFQLKNLFEREMDLDVLIKAVENNELRDFDLNKLKESAVALSTQIEKVVIPNDITEKHREFEREKFDDLINQAEVQPQEEEQSLEGEQQEMDLRGMYGDKVAAESDLGDKVAEEPDVTVEVDPPVLKEEFVVNNEFVADQHARLIKIMENQLDIMRVLRDKNEQEFENSLKTYKEYVELDEKVKSMDSKDKDFDEMLNKRNELREKIVWLDAVEDMVNSAVALGKAKAHIQGMDEKDIDKNIISNLEKEVKDAIEKLEEMAIVGKINSKDINALSQVILEDALELAGIEKANKEVEQPRIEDFVEKLRELNPGVEFNLLDKDLNPNAHEAFESSIPAKDLKLPEPFYYNDKNGITNKHRTKSGNYVQFQVNLISKIKDEDRKELAGQFGDLYEKKPDNIKEISEKSPEDLKDTDLIKLADYSEASLKHLNLTASEKLKTETALDDIKEFLSLNKHEVEENLNNIIKGYEDALKEHKTAVQLHDQVSIIVNGAKPSRVPEKVAALFVKDGGKKTFQQLSKQLLQGEQPFSKEDEELIESIKTMNDSLSDDKLSKEEKAEIRKELLTKVEAIEEREKEAKANVKPKYEESLEAKEAKKYMKKITYTGAKVIHVNQEDVNSMTDAKETETEKGTIVESGKKIISKIKNFGNKVIDKFSTKENNEEQVETAEVEEPAVEEPAVEEPTVEEEKVNDTDEVVNQPNNEFNQDELVKVVSDVFKKQLDEYEKRQQKEIDLLKQEIEALQKGHKKEISELHKMIGSIAKKQSELTHGQFTEEETNTNEIENEENTSEKGYQKVKKPETK